MVQTVLGTFVGILLLVVATWIAIFGGIGALLSRSRGGSVPGGLAWGAGLGPVGWLAILWLTRTVQIPHEPVLPLTGSYSASRAVTPPTPPDRWDPWNK